MSLWGRSDRGRRLVCAKLQGRPVRRALQGGRRDQGACEEERGAILELGGLMKGRGLGVTSGACWESGAHRGSGALGGTLGGVGAPARTCGFEDSVESPPAVITAAWETSQLLLKSFWISHSSQQVLGLEQLHS